MSLKDFYILCEQCQNPVVGRAWVNDEMHPRVYHADCVRDQNCGTYGDSAFAAMIHLQSKQDVKVSQNVLDMIEKTQ